MFALIKTNNASHIAIHIPTDTAAESLPQLVKMLENNAVFIHQSWNETNIVRPEITITLGETYYTEKDGIELHITPKDYVIDTTFEIATPEVLTSNRKMLSKKDAEINKLRTEVSHLKNALENAQHTIDELRAFTEAEK